MKAISYSKLSPQEQWVIYKSLDHGEPSMFYSHIGMLFFAEDGEIRVAKNTALPCGAYLYRYGAGGSVGDIKRVSPTIPRKAFTEFFTAFNAVALSRVRSVRISGDRVSIYKDDVYFKDFDNALCGNSLTVDGGRQYRVTPPRIQSGYLYYQALEKSILLTGNGYTAIIKRWGEK